MVAGENLNQSIATVLKVVNLFGHLKCILEKFLYYSFFSSVYTHNCSVWRLLNIPIFY